MFRYKTHKQAFIIAALVILLCLVCLTGATLALFTNDLSDGTIGVVALAGKVEVDIIDRNGETLQNKSLLFVTTTKQDEILFEPGATLYTQDFQIVNKGSVPIVFTLSVSRDESEDSDIDWEEFDKAFDVWLVPSNDPNFENAELITKIKGEKIPVDGVSEFYRLVVKMREDAGNEFQGKRYEGIGITVYAVQGNAIIKE